MKRKMLGPSECFESGEAQAFTYSTNICCAPSMFQASYKKAQT